MERRGGLRAVLSGIGMAAMAACVATGVPGCPTPGGALEGTWTGDITHVVYASDPPTGSGLTVVGSETITFSADGRPDVLPLALGTGDASNPTGGDILEFTTEKLVAVNDSADFSFPIGSRTVMATLTVTAITPGTGTFSATYDILITFSDAPDVQEKGTYTVTATVGATGDLLWHSEAHTSLSTSATQVPLVILSDGTLTKQGA